MGYLLRSCYASIRYPTVLGGLAKGKSLKVTLYTKRMNDWIRTKSFYEVHPKRIFGFQIYLNAKDMSPISSSIATLGWFNLACSELLRKFLKPGMTFVDVGANIGYYTLLAEKSVGSSGLVIAFEPEPKNFGLLSKTISVNNLSNVRAYQQAVSDEEGEVDLFLSEEANPEAHKLSPQLGINKIKVPSITLDGLYALLGQKRIDFIKIHVGVEPQILHGAKKLLEEQRPIIMMTFARRIWERESDLLENIQRSYSVYKVVESPFLAQKISVSSLLREELVEVLLLPQSLHVHLT